MMQFSIGSVAAIASGWLAVQAVAGPDWNEGGADAGAALGSQRMVSSGGGGPTNSARGLTAAGLVAADNVDLIEIYISDINNFSFMPSFPVNWNARLYLFRGDNNGTNPVYDPPGEPLLWFDQFWDFSGAFGYQVSVPHFDNRNGAMYSAMLDSGEIFYPGRYIIAVCGANSEPGWWTFSPPHTYWWHPTFGPQCAGTHCFPGYNSYGVPVAGAPQTWEFNTPSSTTNGDWKFNTTGVTFIPADSCATAQYVYGPQDIFFQNQLAGDSAGFADACVPMVRDLWFRLFTDCEDKIRVSTCGLVDFDSVIEVYSGNCSAPTLIACRNDGCDDGQGGTKVEFISDPAASGQYLVRVGSRCGDLGGSGFVRIECDDAADINGDGVVNGIDLTELMAGWTGAVPR